MKKYYFLLVLPIIGGGVWALFFKNPDHYSPAEPLNSGYEPAAKGASCQSCHAKEYAEWKTSDHFKAMQKANDSTVLGDFNHATYQADGVISKFYKKEGQYFINTQGQDGLNHDYEILYTFGYFPLQQYLVAFPNGRMQVTRQSWDSRDKKWFHQYAGQAIPPDDWLHWSGNAQNWNTMCAECHSVHLRKNYDPAKDAYNTTFDDIAVTCISCHGPVGDHVKYVQSHDYKENRRQRGSFIKSLASHSSQKQELNACFPCHALKSNIAAEPIASDELLDNYIPEIPSTDLYYADGQARGEVYKYASFLQSKMYRQGVKCTDCHNPHTGKTVLQGNSLCAQCHDASKYDAPSHTFHKTQTGAPECKSCHMPARTYMGNDIRHDHVFRVPRPDLSAKYDVPNACNDCHKDKSAQWAADAITGNFGAQREAHFAEDLILGSRQDERAEPHLSKLISDASTPKNIVATAVHYLSGIPSKTSLQMILSQLKNADAQVRYRSLRALAAFPPQDWEASALPSLKDPVRAVRIAAADLFLYIPKQRIPKDYLNAYGLAQKELKAYILYQTDFAVGSAMAGDYFLKIRQADSAEVFYKRSLEKDPQMSYARLNLSTLYNLAGRNKDALRVLEDALRYNDKDDQIYFNLALLYSEMNQPEKAETAFKLAIGLNSRNPRLYYNYGLFLQHKNQPGNAEKQYLKGLSIAPQDLDLNYVLALLYYQKGDLSAAKKYAALLKPSSKNNTQYRQLLSALGI